jgi:hypothetical protein
MVSSTACESLRYRRFAWNLAITAAKSLHVSLQCLHASLTNCRLFTASCLVTLVFLWNLPLSTMLPSYVKLRETWWEILTPGTACQAAFLCQEEQVSYVTGLQKHMHEERLGLHKEMTLKQSKTPRLPLQGPSFDFINWHPTLQKSSLYRIATIPWVKVPSF